MQILSKTQISDTQAVFLVQAPSGTCSDRNYTESASFVREENLDHKTDTNSYIGKGVYAVFASKIPADAYTPVGA